MRPPFWSQIGLMACAAPLLRFFGAPIWTGLADAWLCHKRLHYFGIAVGTSIHCLFPFMKPTLVRMMQGIMRSVTYACRLIATCERKWAC